MRPPLFDGTDGMPWSKRITAPAPGLCRLIRGTTVPLIPDEKDDVVDWLRQEANARRRRKTDDCKQLTAAAEEIDDLRSYFKHVRAYCAELQKTMTAQKKYIQKLETA